jgi:hypothetical protein
MGQFEHLGSNSCITLLVVLLLRRFRLLHLLQHLVLHVLVNHLGDCFVSLVHLLFHHGISTLLSLYLSLRRLAVLHGSLVQRRRLNFTDDLVLLPDSECKLLKFDFSTLI